MAQFEKHFVQDLMQDIKIRQCGTIVFNADNLSNIISVELYNGTEPYSGGGTVAGAVICPDGATVPLTGTLSGNVASVTLKGDCFAIPGQIGVGVQVISGSIRTTVLKAIYNVELLSTDNMVDPDSRITASVGQLVSDIENAVAQIPASDMASLMAGIAPTFSASTNYTAGAYVYYNGTLYRFTADHTAGSWTGTDATAVVLGNDVADLKSAFVNQQENILPFTIIQNEYVIPNGTNAGNFGTEAGWDRTDFIPLANVYSMTVSATLNSGTGGGYNCYYKADKTFRAQIAVTTEEQTLIPPSDAAYVIFSFSRNVMAEFKPTFVSKTDHQVEINKALALSGTDTILSSASQFVAPYNDCDTLINNTIVTISANPIGNMAHIPDEFNGGTVITVDAKHNGTIEQAQIAIRKDGQIYTRHNNVGWSEWIKYARSGLSLEGSGKVFSASGDFTAPYDDCNTFPNNSTVTIIANASSLVDNLPSEFAQGTIITVDATGSDTIAKAQIAIRKNGTISSRHKWGDDWSDWYTPAPETLADFSMFPDFAVLGDSFASGTILTQQGSIWGMYPNYAWPKILSRMTGSEVANYSTSGLSTRTWLTDPVGLSAMLNDTPKALYLLCLGINDGAIYNEDSSYLGSVADMKSDYTQNPDTFYGNYGRIIGNIKTHAPNASIILIANPTYNTSSTTWQLFQSAMAEIAEEAGIPYVAGHADPYFDSSFYQNGQATAHPIAITYSGTAKAYKRQVELAIQNNTEYFWNVH